MEYSTSVRKYCVCVVWVWTFSSFASTFHLFPDNGTRRWAFSHWFFFFFLLLFWGAHVLTGITGGTNSHPSAFKDSRGELDERAVWGMINTLKGSWARPVWVLRRTSISEQPTLGGKLNDWFGCNETAGVQLCLFLLSFAWSKEINDAPSLREGFYSLWFANIRFFMMQYNCGFFFFFTQASRDTHWQAGVMEPEAKWSYYYTF